METVLLNARRVRQRYGGLSEMSLWRWLNDERLAFPKPLIVNTRRYWWQHELEAWERTRVASVGHRAALIQPLAGEQTA
jgi:predicted DNA-binding transcriptional regulator AlpA